MKDEVERLEKLKELLLSTETQNEDLNVLEEGTDEEKGYSKILLPKGARQSDEVIESIPDNYNKAAFVNILSLSLIAFVTEALFLIIAYFVFK